MTVYSGNRLLEYVYADLMPSGTIIVFLEKRITFMMT